MKRRFGVLFLSGFFLSACATTRIDTLSRDLPAGGYKKILVVIPAENDDVRNQLEEEFAGGLSRKPVQAVPSLTLLLPRLDPESAEAAPILKENEIDAVLTLKQLTPYHEPLTSIPGRKPKPHIRYELDLFDTKSGQVVWTAESFTVGQLLSTLNVLHRSLLKGTRNKLRKENLVPL